MQQLPKDIIMTPHPKEFDRLEGHSADSFERLSKARDLAQRLQAYVILKGHRTALCCLTGTSCSTLRAMPAWPRAAAATC
jgi:NAD(P)H-hydrate epimerase